MQEIILNEAPSPVVCKLLDKEITLLNAIEIRNQLTTIIHEYQSTRNMTFREIFQKYLPQEIAEKAIKNSGLKADEISHALNVKDAIYMAFNFILSPEGNLWYELANAYQDIKIYYDNRL